MVSHSDGQDMKSTEVEQPRTLSLQEQRLRIQQLGNRRLEITGQRFKMKSKILIFQTITNLNVMSLLQWKAITFRLRLPSIVKCFVCNMSDVASVNIAHL